MWFRYSTSKCVCVGGSQFHQPRPMVGHSCRGSLAEPDLWMRALESKVSWIVGKNLPSPKKTLCRGKTCTFGPLKGHLSQVCSAACLHLSACLWVTSLKRYWFNPFLCQSSDLREHGGCGPLQPAHSSEVSISTRHCKTQWEVLKPLLTSPGLVYAFKMAALLP